MWAWLVRAILAPFFGAISDWLKAQQVRADEQRLGQQSQQSADIGAAAAVKAAESAAQADAPSTQADAAQAWKDGKV